MRPGELDIVESTTVEISQPQDSITQTEIRLLPGLCKVFRQLVPKLSRVNALVNMDICKDQPKSSWLLTVNEKRSVGHFKGLLTKPPLLTLPWATGHYTIVTDVSNEQIGSVLLQEYSDGSEKKVEYCSRRLSDKKRKLAKTPRECIAILWTLLLLRPYLEGIRFSVRKNYGALKRLFKMSYVSQKRARRRVRLSEYEFDIIHHTSARHPAADSLYILWTGGIYKKNWTIKYRCWR